MTIDEMRDDIDWVEAFNFHPMFVLPTNCKADSFTMENVVSVHKSKAGENDGESWVCTGSLKDDRFFCLDAWCDYTGWDCQSDGDVQVADTLENLIKFGMTEEIRERLEYFL